MFNISQLALSNSDQTEPLSELIVKIMMHTDRFGIYNWIYYILIYILLVFIYNKVFKTRRLPILKSAIVYIIMALGAFMLLLFQTDAGLPIVYSLGVAVLLMLVVRIRYFIEGRRARQGAKSSEDGMTDKSTSQTKEE